MTEEARVAVPEEARLAVTARARWRPVEALPWLFALAVPFLFPGYVGLGVQVLVAVLFVLSLDLVLGYAGIVTLGHAAFFGVGAYTVGLLSVRAGWTEPISGLVFAALAAAAVGWLTGRLILRFHGLTVLMLTLAASMLLQEAGNSAAAITGGHDGLTGIAIAPILGRFENDLFGVHYYAYSLVVVFAAFVVVRRIVHSPFGRSLVGIRENRTRMAALGADVPARLVRAYTIGAALAGVAGALYAQYNAFVTLNLFGFERSGTALVMLVLGGVGRLYGAIVGVPLYMLLEDRFAKISPEFWGFGIGLLLVLGVLFLRGGLAGSLAAIFGRARGPRGGGATDDVRFGGGQGG
jgi:branched-chain amino acid transport system permease protein